MKIPGKRNPTPGNGTALEQPTTGRVARPSETADSADPTTFVFASDGSSVSNEDAALRMLAAGTAVSVTVGPNDRGGVPTGPSFSLGPLAHGLTEIASLSKAPTEALFRVTVPAGQTIDNLVPALGGGYRGLVKATGSSKITGAARLQKVAPAAAGGGALVALGPLAGMIALGVVADMLAQHQMNKRLDAIANSVNWLVETKKLERKAELQHAGEALHAAANALLDGTDPGSMLGVDSAASLIGRRAVEARAQIDKWEAIIDALPDGKRVDGPELLHKLAGKDSTPQQFAQMVADAALALTLDARRVTLGGIQARVSNPGSTLENLTSALDAQLIAITDVQDRLTRMFGRLSSKSIGTGFFTTPGSDHRSNDFRAVVGGLHVALLAQTDAIPVLDGNHNVTLDFVRAADGTFHVLEPAKAARATAP